MIAIAIIAAVVVLTILTSAVKVVQQYELGVVFRFGRLVGTRKPGIRIIIPLIDQMRKIDTRVVTIDVPSQEVLTKDNVTAKVNAVVFLRVMDPEKAVVEVYDYKMATYQMSQTTLRSVLGQHELDELLIQRDVLNQRLREIIDESTDPWGVKVSSVEIKDVELPSTMQRAMAAQAEAERERRAKIIHAEGEFQASQKLADAAVIIAKEPTAIQLRYLQTLTEIATEKTTTVVFPLPIDLLSGLLGKGAQHQSPQPAPVIPSPAPEISEQQPAIDDPPVQEVSVETVQEEPEDQQPEESRLEVQSEVETEPTKTHPEPTKDELDHLATAPDVEFMGYKPTPETTELALEMMAEPAPEPVETAPEVPISNLEPVQAETKLVRKQARTTDKKPTIPAAKKTKRKK